MSDKSPDFSSAKSHILARYLTEWNRARHAEPPLTINATARLTLADVVLVADGTVTVAQAKHHVITADTGAFTISTAAPRIVVTSPRPVLGWLDSAAVFVPKSIREPFLGDLREDLAGMRAAGRSRAIIRWAACSQVVVLILRWAWSSIRR